MNARLLIAEDHEAARELIRHALDGQGYELEFAQTGVQALEALQRRSFDAAFLDLALPELTGSDVCRRVKADPERQDVPIILMSGALASRELAEEARRIGADAYLAKPFSLAELRTIARAFTKIHEQDRTIEELRHELDSRRASEDDTVRLDWNLPYHDFMRLARKKYFLHALAQSGGNKSRLARRSGLDRSTLYVHFRNLGMMPTRKKDTGEGAAKASEPEKRESKLLPRHSH